DQDLAKRNAVAERQVEQQEREVLSQESRIQTTRNSLALIPVERERLKAQRAVSEANLKQAELDVTKTTIVAPFKCDIGDVSVEEGQYVTAGQTLVAALDISRSEVEAAMPMIQLGRLIPEKLRDVVTFDQTVIETASTLGIRAELYMVGAPRAISWKARLVRVRERYDERTRTLGFVVAVDDPYAGAKPGVKPPLTKGMFCELFVRGRPQKDRIVIPRSALRNGGDEAYVVVDGRLEKRKVVIEFRQADFAVVAGGLRAGDVVIVSDPAPAIVGMKIDPHEDRELAARMVEQAGSGA
ncbi:MAG: efflux RND transporter periplasmic adaptor subunit, partial [Planctomycetota bacterium]|nr:efflux RND transporter periplasmic adaptor subunit [Planctomycetota bacterium]